MVVLLNVLFVVVGVHEMVKTTANSKSCEVLDQTNTAQIDAVFYFLSENTVVGEGFTPVLESKFKVDPVVQPVGTGIEVIQ